jgi:hypothetical protein
MLVLSIHTKKAALNLITEKKHEFGGMLEEGFIDDAQYKIARKEIDDQFIGLQNADFEWNVLTFQEVLLECPMFSDLSQEERRELRKGGTEISFDAGKTILMKDKIMTQALIVVSGTVKETYSSFKVTRGVGNLLAAFSIVSGDECKCVLRAQSNCKLLAFKLDVFREIMAKNTVLEGRVYRSAFVSAVKIDEHNKLNFLPERRLRSIAEKSVMTHLQVTETVFVEYGAFLFRGGIVSAQEVYPRSNKVAPNELTVPQERRSDHSSEKDHHESLPSFGARMSSVSGMIFESPKMIREGVTVRATSDCLMLTFKVRLEDKSARVSRLSRIVDEHI